MDILSAANKLTCLKINENDEICLNVKHSYYTQIQSQMGILNISKCYFVLQHKAYFLIQLNADSLLIPTLALLAYPDADPDLK